VTNHWGKICRNIFGLLPEETSYARRQFRGATDQMRTRLEQIGAAFLAGYHAALEAGQPETFNLPYQDPELDGFGMEGGAMGFALLDALMPWNGRRIERFLAGEGDAHAYMVHVGVGWIWARLPFGMERARRRLDPLLSWLAFDGWGFHEGFFHWPNYIHGEARPRKVKGYAGRVFDQGLGRSFWFVNGGNPELIGETIRGFPAERRADLWSGIGLAATYAGIASREALEVLGQGAGEHRPALAQGAAFAAKARLRAGNVTPYTDLATRALCGLDAIEAARLTDSALENLPENGPQPAYEIWRQRIQSCIRRASSASRGTGLNSERPAAEKPISVAPGI
jgi:hypothetical protein